MISWVLRRCLNMRQDGRPMRVNQFLQISGPNNQPVYFFIPFREKIPRGNIETLRPPFKIKGGRSVSLRPCGTSTSRQKGVISKGAPPLSTQHRGHSRIIIIRHRVFSHSIETSRQQETYFSFLRSKSGKCLEKTKNLVQSVPMMASLCYN